jgi:hypothetical protein
MAASGAKGKGSGAPLPVLDAGDLLAKQTLREEYVDVPEWGCRVKVRELSMGAYQQVQEKASNNRGEIDQGRLSAYLVIAGIVEPDLGDDAYEWVRGQSMRAINRILDRILELSGLGAGALEDAEAMFLETAGENVEVPASA